ncbi:MAG: cupin domain-containing protein [Microgenomates group bacterium]|jgi:quercetin dioxygenase-like cupin family protein
MKPLNLVNAIEYQKDAVVSKEILKTPSGTITLFAFDEGQGLSEHTTPFEALVQIIDGEAEITISGEKHNVLIGEIIHMPANIPHALKAKKKFKMLLTMRK